MVDRMKMCNIKVERKSMDKNTNNLGHKLIDVCISQEMLIYSRAKKKVNNIETLKT